MSAGFNCGCSCAGAAPCTVTRGFTVVGCSSAPISGATVSVTKTGGSTTTGTTNTSGNVTFTGLTSGSYTYTISATRYASASGSFTVAVSCLPSTGTVAGVTLSPASGYHCLCFCTTPVADTLHLTDPVTGSVTLTYNTSTGFWEGAKSGTWTSRYGTGGTVGTQCNTPTYNLTYQLNYSSFSVSCALYISGPIDLKLWTDRSNNGVLTCDPFGPTAEGRPVGAQVHDTASCTSAPVLTLTTPVASGDGLYGEVSGAGSTATFTITE